MKYRDFAAWLDKELKQRSWSQADFARKSNLHRAVISKILNRQSFPEWETLENIAAALNYPIELVYQKAGVLPEKIQPDPITTEADYLLSKLSVSQRKQALSFIRFLAEGKGEYHAGKEPPLEAPE